MYAIRSYYGFAIDDTAFPPPSGPNGIANHTTVSAGRHRRLNTTTVTVLCLRTYGLKQIRITSYNVCYTKLLRDAPVFHAFVLTAIAFIIFGRPKNLSTKQPVAFGLKSSVIDGFRLFDLAVRPFANLFRRSRITSYNVCYTKLLRTREQR